MADTENNFFEKRIPSSRPGSIRSLVRIFREVQPYLKFLVAIQILGFITLGVNSAIPFILKYLTDALQEGNLSILIWVPPITFALVILLSVFTVLCRMLSSFISMTMGFNLQERLYKHFMALDMFYHLGSPLGSKMARITFDINWIVQGAMMFFSDILFLPVTITVYTALMFFIDWKLTLVAAIAFPLVLAASSVISRKLKRTSTHLQEQNTTLSRHLVDTLGGIIIVKAFRRENLEISRFALILKEYLHKGMRDAIWRSILKPTAHMINTLFLCLVGWYAFYRLMVSENLTVSNFVAFSALMLLFNRETKKITEGFQALARTAASYERMDVIFGLKAPLQHAGVKTVKEFKHRIIAEMVEFAYDEKPVLLDVNLSIARGEFVAISGSSGAGKTTLIRILVGLLTPQKGMVTIDDIDLCNIDLESLRFLFSYVPQTTILFNISIRDNIVYGRPAATEEEIRHVGHLACAHDFIKTLPQGYDTQVGEMGERLSGGQRQQIAIARALLLDAPIIVFDECFSNIDVITERQIYQNLMELSTHKTLIIVTHRLETVLSADRIYHISDERIGKSGSHEELMELDSSYKYLYLKQKHLGKRADLPSQPE